MTTQASHIIEVSQTRLSWPGHDSFELQIDHYSQSAGETVLLLGESGSGKSTFLSLLCGTLAPKTGKTSIAGTDITGLRAAQRDRFRAEKIGVIFQQFNLLPFATVLDNIRLPLQFAPERRKRVDDVNKTAARLCEDLGLPAEILARKAGTLSVGQQQRVAVARAFIGSPPLIIADEPTSALDANTQAAFIDLLLKQAQSSGTSVLMVSHDARLSSHFDRTLHLSDILSSGEMAA